ncbi:MAG: transporter substrate-binding domain-containing protein [Desulfobacter sp.]|nr:MAG: transporter substrate-binding domain-containing protein [Desulfobacter sp.]
MKILLFKYRIFFFLAGISVILAVGYKTILPEPPALPESSQILLSPDDQAWIKDNPVITVGVDTDFAPIEDIDKEGNYIGVTADFLSLVTEKTGLRFKFDHEHSWTESLGRIKAGEIDMLGAAVASDRRRRFMDFTQPYAWLSGVIIVHKSVTEPMSLEKLKGMKVTVVHNYIWRDYLAANYPDLLLNPAQDIEAALKKVSFGMADAMVGYMATASHHIERLGISNLKISGKTVSVLDIAFAVNREKPQLKRILNQVLAQTTEAQKKQILRKWISLEFTRAYDFGWLVTRIFFPGAAVAMLGFIGVILWNRSLQRQVIQRTEKLNQELVQRTHMEQALRESEEKYKSIYRNIQDVYYEILPQGRVIEISPSVEKVFGYKREVLINRSMAKMFQESEEFRRMLDKAAKEQRLDDHGTVLVCPDGNSLNCSMNAVMIRDSHGTPVKIVGSIHNITERVKAQKALRSAYKELQKRVRERTAELRNTNRELNKAKEEADAATRAKSAFLANMSHEIRTPLSGVISASELVMHESLPKKVARYINIIRSSGHALLGVIDDILDFSKIEAGKLEIEVHTFHLDQLITRTANLFKHKIKDKNISFTADITPDTPAHLLGDSFRVQQILTNLLSNAVKFTDRGGEIRLRVTGHACTHKADRVFMEFEVADSGIGISPEHQDLLFTPFSQIDASTTRKYGGSGLGLSICGQLVEMMEGTITVESEPNQGSRFVFTIPLERTADQGIGPDEDGGHQVSLSEYREKLKDLHILVAEDTPTNQKIILAVLDLVGCRTVLVDTGAKAVAAVKADRFDAVLMDLQMPEMDGFEATRAIRKVMDRTDLPIIAMTAHTLKEDKGKCMAAGMNAYVSKPVNQEKLFSTLIRLIRNNETGTDLSMDRAEAEYRASQPSAPGLLPDYMPGIEIRRALHALGVGNEIFLGILHTFFNTHEGVIAEIEAAWETGERDRVINLVHSLKGSAAGIGAFEVHSLAKELEALCKSSPRLLSIKKAGLGVLENRLAIVLASIKSLDTKDTTSDGILPQGRETEDKASIKNVLARLDKALEFPEFLELEGLCAELAAVCSHPEGDKIRFHIGAHDHDLAREAVRNLTAVLET